MDFVIYALVIWKTFVESECESQFCCINVETILNPQMFIVPKVYGHICVNVVDFKGNKLRVFEQWFRGKVLTTGGISQYSKSKVKFIKFIKFIKFL